MIKLNFISFFMIFSFLHFISSAGIASSVEMLMPKYAEDLKFSYFTNEGGNRFSSKELNLFFLNRANNKCNISINTIITNLNSFNFWVNMENLIPNARKDWEKLNVVVAIDYFGDLFASRSSYFLGDFPEPGNQLIAMDCRLFTSDLWQSKLVHEMSHALLERYQLPIWFEEMIAMNLESTFNPQYSHNSVTLLSHQNVLLNPLKKTKPFEAPQRYTLNFLLSNYLQQTFFKSSFLREYLLDLRKKSFFPASTNSAIFSQMRYLSKNSPSWVPRELDEKTLLKHFYLALSLNQDDREGRNIFTVDRWRSYVAKPVSSFSELRLLESYGAMRVSLEFSHKLLLSLSPQVVNDLEVILIESSFGEYRLLNGKSFDLQSFAKVPGKIYEVLIINWGSDYHFKN